MSGPRLEKEILLDVLYRMASYCASGDEDRAGHALQMTREICEDLRSAGTSRDLQAILMIRKALGDYGIPSVALELSGGVR